MHLNCAVITIRIQFLASRNALQLQDLWFCRSKRFQEFGEDSWDGAGRAAWSVAIVAPCIFYSLTVDGSRLCKQWHLFLKKRQKCKFIVSYLVQSDPHPTLHNYTLVTGYVHPLTISSPRWAYSAAATFGAQNWWHTHIPSHAYWLTSL